jgi:hypothetical protein
LLINIKIQHVESEEWLGALIQANDQLVNALMTFEQLDTSIDADSDSDDELAEQAHAYRSKKASAPDLLNYADEGPQCYRKRGKLPRGPPQNLLD